MNCLCYYLAEVALMVEHLTCNQGVAGSTPVLGSTHTPVAQLEELIRPKDKVGGSSPLRCTKFIEIVQLDRA